jgi:glycine/D-amino acid oxidase-like deaminating enzyme
MEPAPADPADLPSSTDLCVVGAGVMGAWTAFWAQAGGAGPDEDWGGGRTVTLLDAWGAGHLRATSSDEHRIIRSAHGTDRPYASAGAEPKPRRVPRAGAQPGAPHLPVLFIRPETRGSRSRALMKSGAHERGFAGEAAFRRRVERERRGFDQPA